MSILPEDRIICWKCNHQKDRWFHVCDPKVNHFETRNKGEVMGGGTDEYTEEVDGKKIPTVSSDPFVKDSIAAGYKWTRITQDVARDRVYVYADGNEFAVKNVEFVCFKESPSPKGHSHRIRTTHNECIYVAPGWVAIKWKGKFEF